MKKALLLILGIISIYLLFYWFQIRPSEIRKKCEYDASNKYRYQQKRLNNFYRSRLVQNGMKPESLLVNIK
jgi:hypothetical protein